MGRNQCLAVFQHGIRPLGAGGGQVVAVALPPDRVPTDVFGFGLPREHEFPDGVFHSVAVSRVEFGQAAPHRFGFGLAGQKRHQFAWRAPVYLVGFVQFSGVHVQLAFAIAHAIALKRVVVGPRLSGPVFVYLDGRQNVLGHGGFVDVAGVEIEAVIREANGGETLVHGVQGRRFLGAEQHFLSFGQEMGDQIGDGLALARAGRAAQDEAGALVGRGYRRGLVGIGRQHRQQFARRILVVECVGRNVRRVGLTAVAGDDFQCAAIAVAALSDALQVFIHGHLLKLEQAQAGAVAVQLEGR